MINPTDKDIGRKVVWYPALESRQPHYIDSYGDIMAIGELWKARPIMGNASVRFPAEVGLPSFCEYSALDWADDL